MSRSKRIFKRRKGFIHEKKKEELKARLVGGSQLKNVSNKPLCNLKMRACV